MKAWAIKKPVIQGCLGIAVALLLLHNFLLTVSLIPANPLSIRYAHQAVNYINRLSPQGWFFFTPVPTKSHMVVFRDAALGPGAPWQNPFLDAIQKHRRNPFGFSEKVAYIHMSLSRDLAIFFEMMLDAQEVDKEKALKNDPIYRQLISFLHFYGGKDMLVEWQFVEYVVPRFSERAVHDALIENILMKGFVQL